jgi:hypothetical protein
MRTDNGNIDGNLRVVFTSGAKNQNVKLVALIDVAGVQWPWRYSQFVDCVSVVVPIIAAGTVSEVIVIGEEKNKRERRTPLIACGGRTFTIR